MKITTLPVDKLTVLDVIGLLEAPSWLPDAEIVGVGPRRGPLPAVPPGGSRNVERNDSQPRCDPGAPSRAAADIAPRSRAHEKHVVAGALAGA